MPFTTCSRCGLSFDAAPKERAVRPERPVPTGELATAGLTRPEQGRRRIPLWPVVGAALGFVVALGVAYEYAWSPRAERTDREVQDVLQRSLADMRDHAARTSFKTGLAPCDQLAQQSLTRPICATPEATEAVTAALAHIHGAMNQAADASALAQRCADGVAELAAVRARVSCPAPRSSRADVQQDRQ